MLSMVNKILLKSKIKSVIKIYFNKIYMIFYNKKSNNKIKKYLTFRIGILRISQYLISLIKNYYNEIYMIFYN